MGLKISGTKARNETRDITPQQFTNEFRDDVAGSLLSFINSGGGPELSNSDLRRFRKNYAVPPTAGELASLGRLETFATNPAVSELFAEDLTARTLAGEFLDPNSATTKNFIAAALRPIEEEEAAAQLATRGAFTQAGQRISASSPFAETQRQTERDFRNTKADTRAEILFNVREAERGRQQVAVDQAREAAAFRFERELGNLEAQGLPRLIEQHGLDLGTQVYTARINALAQVLGVSAGAAGATPAAQGRSNTKSFGI